MINPAAQRTGPSPGAAPGSLFRDPVLRVPPARRPRVRRAHLPNKQVLRLSGKCAPSAPLLRMVTRRPAGPIFRTPP